ncbi:hypothetical protein GCM10009616_28690 [Microlunatus lacustris]
MRLKQFETRLEELIGRLSALRPFVCEGSPLTCRVFIVGINPATSMTRDFWDFWRPAVGFDKGAWSDAYRREREAQPLKPDRIRRQAISPTRQRLDLVAEGAKPVRCLETNLFSTPTSAASELSAASRSTAAFDFLLETIKLSLIVAYGVDAASYFAERDLTQEVWTEKHFSRGWSLQEARELGQRIRSHLGGAAGESA